MSALMNTRSITIAGVLAVTLSGAGLLASCSDDDNPAPAGPNVPDGGNGTDSGGGADTGPCVSDRPTCNSCTSATDDPYNACSEAAGGCVPFDNDTRIPKGENGAIPVVP